MAKELRIEIAGKNETLRIFEYNDGLVSIAITNNKTGEDHQALSSLIKPTDAVAIGASLIMWAGRQE